jgi:hypothetical protein
MYNPSLQPKHSLAIDKWVQGYGYQGTKNGDMIHKKKSGHSWTQASANDNRYTSLFTQTKNEEDEGSHDRTAVVRRHRRHGRTAVVTRHLFPNSMLHLFHMCFLVFIFSEKEKYPVMRTVHNAVYVRTTILRSVSSGSAGFPVSLLHEFLCTVKKP